MRPFSEWRMIILSAGRKSEHIVGMPTPRLAIQPSWNSAVMRAAIMSRVSRSPIACSSGGSCGANPRDVEDAVRRDLDDALDIDAGRVHLAGIDAADRHDLLDFCDRGLCCHRHDRVEVALRALKNQVAEFVARF